MKVSLKDVVEALEFLTDEHFHFLDRQTGKVEMVSREVLGIVEESGDDEDAEEWQEDEFKVAEAIFADWDRFEKLPTKYDVNEWEIMRGFAESVEPERFSNDLQNAIHGAGAFRNFKYIVRRDGIEQAWFAFRTDALRQIAIDWCEENQISWE